MSVVLGKSAWKLVVAVLGGVSLAAAIASAAAGRSYSTAATYHVDHQLCYSATGKFKIPLSGTNVPAVRLKNQFSPDGFVPTIQPGLAYHCNPVVKTIHTAAGQQVFKVTNPAAHLACLPLTAATQSPHKVVVTNQFGSATLSAQQPNLLCLPSWKSLTGPPKKTPPTPPGLSHFTCYPVGVASGAYKPPAVLLRDEFSTKPVAAQVNPIPKELCVPTEKIVGAHDYKIVDPVTQLLCFAVTKTPIKPKVWDENQFGTSAVNIRATKWLCVPSTMTTPPTGHLYWVNQGSSAMAAVGTVNEVPLAGGSVTTLASGLADPYWLAVNGTDAYWVDQGDGTVDEVPLGGGSVTTLASGQDDPNSLALDGSNVYWTNWVGGTVKDVPLGGGTPTTLASGQKGPVAVAVDGTHVYWVDVPGPAPTGTVNKVPIGGGSVTTLASGQSIPAWVAVNGTDVYWTDNGGGTVNGVPVGGGTVATLAPSQSQPWEGALDNTHLYWVNQGDGTVNEVPLGGGSVTTLASGQSGPQSIAVGP